MNFDLKNHISGKVYDLTQENMNAMIRCIEELRNKYEAAIINTLEFREALESVAFLQQPKSVNPEFWEKRNKVELIKTITTDTDICREVLAKYPQSQEKE